MKMGVLYIPIIAIALAVIVMLISTLNSRQAASEARERELEFDRMKVSVIDAFSSFIDGYHSTLDKYQGPSRAVMKRELLINLRLQMSDRQFRLIKPYLEEDAGSDVFASDMWRKPELFQRLLDSQ